MESVLTKMEVYLEETLLSNAKLLYQNRTLGDASLNERQKSKIVEAIANAESPKEAKNFMRHSKQQWDRRLIAKEIHNHLASQSIENRT
jgi:hypothetical protein